MDSRKMNFLSDKKISPIIKIHRNDMNAFKILLDDPVLKEFFKFDSCNIYADKYLIAMVFTYFKRAQFTYKQYTRYNFFVALFLAHDMEEDNEDLKNEIFFWALGENWQHNYKNLLKSRETLWQEIQHRGVVSRKCCDRVISMAPTLHVWRRFRSESHGGTIRNESDSYDNYDSSQDICCEKIPSIYKYSITDDESGCESDNFSLDLITSDESFGNN